MDVVGHASGREEYAAFRADDALDVVVEPVAPFGGSGRKGLLTTG